VATSTTLKAILRPLVDAAARVFERMLASVARISGTVAPPSVARWVSPGGLRVVVVAPHPDDESVGCAGTIIRHLAAADEATIVYVTDGSGSRALGLTAAEMRRRRREEAHSACEQLGVTRVRWLGLDEREWNTGELTTLLAGLVRELVPDVIYTPSCVDFHPDHHRVAHALARALGSQQSRSLLVRAYQVQVPLTGILINLIADVSPHEAEIRSALDQYVTQRATIATTLRLRRYQSRYYGHPSVEVFWEIAGDRFVRLHDDPPSSRATPFRGVRPRPFTDPLAFWFGRKERRTFMLACSKR
jgi:LmbE family N-acetylglucosaminyl deacetylase